MATSCPHARIEPLNACRYLLDPIHMSVSASPNRTRLRRIGWIVLASLLFVLAYFRAPLLAWHWSTTLAPDASSPAHRLQLSDYRAVIQAQPIAGIHDNLSGLTYSEATGNLFAAVNRPAQIVELDTRGNLLRTVHVDGVRDMESIAHVAGGLFLVACERESTLYEVELTPGATTVQARAVSQAPLQTLHRNRGIEALAWNRHSRQMLIGQESFPVRLLQSQAVAAGGDPGAPPTRGWHPPGNNTSFMSDLSGMAYHEPSGHLFLLSDESALIAEYTAAGELVSVIPLWRGFHGLQRKIPQAEGLTLSPDGVLFVVSEPNLFYRFEHAAPLARE